MYMVFALTLSVVSRLAEIYKNLLSIVYGSRLLNFAFGSSSGDLSTISHKLTVNKTDSEHSRVADRTVTVTFAHILNSK